MTELLTRTHAAAARVGDRAAASSVWLRGCLAALWAVSLGVAALVVLVLVAWAADSRSGAGAGEAIRGALQLWLAGHRVPMHVAGGTVAVAPLGLTLALGFLVARAAAVVARGQGASTPAEVGLVTAAVGVPYAVLTAFVAAAANSAAVRPDPIAALAGGVVMGGVAAAWGAARGTRLVRSLWALAPQWARQPVVAGAAALGVVAGCGLLLLAGSLVLHGATAVSLSRALGGGFVGAVALVLVDLALVPNGVAWMFGYLAGPGFAVGAGTSVSLGGARLGPVPALPLLAALPHGPAPWPVAVLGVLSLAGAGVLAGWLVCRAQVSMLRALAHAAGAGAAAGVAAAVLTALAAGPAGPGRMSAVGASPWQTGLALAGEVAAAACGTAAALRWWRAR